MKPKLFDVLDQLKKPKLGQDFYASCAVGHEVHTKHTLPVALHGPALIPGLPEIPDHLAHHFDMQIYRWQDYFKTVDGNETMPLYDRYCPGQDIISYCIERQGQWEGVETAVVLDILNEDNDERGDVVLDFGSHIGWYTTLAGLAGYRTAAFDGNQENLMMVDHNASVNNVAGEIYTYLCWLDERAPVLPADKESVQLLKCDIEGNDRFAIGMARDLLNAKKIKYLLLEVSPVFNDSYPELVEHIAAAGYKVYQLPPYNWKYNDEMSKAPLETVIKYCEVPDLDRRGYVEQLHQENFLFVREEPA